MAKNELMDVFKLHTELKNCPEDLEHHLEVTKLLPSNEWAKVVLKTAERTLKGAEPSLSEQVCKHFGGTLYATIKKYVRPFNVLMLAAEQITPKEFLEVMLRHSPEDRIIFDFVPVEKYVEVMRASNEAFFNHEVKPKLSLDSFKELPAIKEKDKQILDKVLENIKWPETNQISEAFSALWLAKDVIKGLMDDLDGQKETMEDLRSRLMASAMVSAPVMEVEGSGEIPNGKTVRRMFSEVFPSVPHDGKDFEITCWEWDGPHPMVPKVDEHYIFRHDLLIRVLYAMETNQRAYLQGHTGSGKTTLLEQVAAHLGYPFMRINFDSEITRMDLIGRDTLVDGKSQFIDGMLPTMMQQPCIGCFDEIDFCRPDVAYVMQSALENNSLRITEDGGREVKPHPFFRMFGTGNTVGQGDEMGMYQGARPQSLAFLDRFTVWLKVDYLAEEDRTNLIRRHFPALSEEHLKQISKYVTEHIAAFTDSKVLQPISPRGMLAVAKAVAFMTMIGNKNPLREALQQTVLDRATSSDYPTLLGIVDRVCK